MGLTVVGVHCSAGSQKFSLNMNYWVFTFVTTPILLIFLVSSTYSKFLSVKSVPFACYLLISAPSAALSRLIDQLAHVI